MGKFIKTALEINLNRLSQNYKTLKALLKRAKCGAVVKANAYGVGMVRVVERLAKEGCEDFFVANLDEALKCRKNLSAGNIYVFHGVNCIMGAAAAVRANLTPILSDLSQVEIWNNYGKSISKRLPAILHFETGMGRLELQKSDAILISKHPDLISNIEVKYIMSHLACPDLQGNKMNEEQLRQILEYQKMFKQVPVTLANSDGILLGEDYEFDLVRAGAALYGVNSSKNKQSPFVHVVTLKAGVLQKKILEKDQTLGYGATFSAKKGDKLLTLECGYADGYFRSLSNLSRGYYNNKALPQVGRVSMDMAVFNANNLTEEEFAEIKYVELLGDNITVNEVAEYAGTIGYEVLTSLGNRFKKVYMD